MSAVLARQPVSADTIHEILSFISANCDRPYWVRILAGIKDELGDAGEGIAREWSQSAPDRFDQAEFKSTWRSLQPGKGITIATVIHEAKQHGYRPKGEERRTDPAEIARYRKERAEALAKQQEQDAERYEAAALEAAEILDAATGDPSTHPYTVRKGGISLGPRVKRGPWPQRGWTDALLLPIFQADAKAWSIEAIPAEEGIDKDSLKGGRKSGGIYPVGKISGAARVIIAEGAATAAACHAATGLPAVAALSAGNFKAAARTVRTLAPDAEVIFAADFDRKADGSNPGLKAALAAATELKAAVAVPQLEGRPCDFWDVWSERGPGAVKAAIEKAARVEGDAPRLAAAPEYPAPEDRPTKARRYELRTAGDLAATPPAAYRVKGLLMRESLAVIFGAPGSGKTFLSLDAAFAISDGLEWFGRRVAPCDVLYIALEGVAGLAQRVKAYRERHGEDRGARLRFVTSPLSLRYSDDVDALIATILEAGIRDGVIFLDTFNAAAPGMEENASADMSLAIAAINRIRTECGGLVVLIHHPGKDATRGLRGHSSLPAALDTIIEVTRDGDRRSWRLSKSKDGADGEEHAFGLEVAEVGTDADGDPVTSCVVVHNVPPIDRSTAGRLPAGGNQRLIWDALGPLFTASPHFGKAGAPSTRPCLELEGAVTALRDRLTCDPKRRPERTRAALAGLVNRGALQLNEGWLWCV